MYEDELCVSKSNFSSYKDFRTNFVEKMVQISNHKITLVGVPIFVYRYYLLGGTFRSLESILRF